MTEDSILSHLALRFAAHPENIATEALAFILQRSEVCRSALSAIVSRFCSDTGSCTLYYESQSSGEDLSRPDLAGRDSEGRVRLMLEAKFWAGLTDNQPVGYLGSLAEPGALIFVAPETRLDLLWPELVHRVREAGYLDATTETELLRSVRLAERTLAVISWRMLLGTLLAAAESARELGTAADIRQLAALCERMDTEAFLPLTSEDLNPFTGRRIAQFAELASRLTDLLVARGDADVKGLRAAGGQMWWGRYLRLRGYAAEIYFSADIWAQWGGSPLWITIRDPDWKPSKAIMGLVQGAGISAHHDTDGTHIPIRLLTGAELDTVTRHALDQIVAIAHMLPAADAAGEGAPAGQAPVEARDMNNDEQG